MTRLSHFMVMALIASKTDAFTTSQRTRTSQTFLAASNDPDALGFEVELPTKKPKLMRPLSLMEELQPPPPVPAQPEEPVQECAPQSQATSVSAPTDDEVSPTPLEKEEAASWGVLSSMSTKNPAIEDKVAEEFKSDRVAEEIEGVSNEDTAPATELPTAAEDPASTVADDPPRPSVEEQEDILASILGKASPPAAPVEEAPVPVVPQEAAVPQTPPATGLSKYVELQNTFFKQPSSSYPQQHQYQQQSRQQVIQRNQQAPPQQQAVQQQQVVQQQQAMQQQQVPQRQQQVPQQSYMASYDALDKFTSSRSSFGYMKQPHEMPPNESQVRKHQAYLANREVVKQKRALPQPAMVDTMGSFIETRSSFGTMKKPHEEYLAEAQTLRAQQQQNTRALNAAPPQQQLPQQASGTPQSLSPTKTDYVRPYQASHDLPDKSIEELRDNPSSNPMNKFNNLQNGFKNIGTDRMMVVPTAPENLRQVEPPQLAPPEEAAAPPPAQASTAAALPEQPTKPETPHVPPSAPVEQSNPQETATSKSATPATSDLELQRLREENASLHGKVDELTDTLKTFMSKFEEANAKSTDSDTSSS